MKHTMQLYKRALQDIFVIGKRYFILYFLQSLAQHSLPFIGFIYMTRIVNALTEQNMAVIPTYIMHYLIILFILQLISGWLNPITTNEKSMFLTKLFSLPNKKMLSMQYQLAESAQIRAELEYINQSMMRGQSSLPTITMRIELIIPQLIRIIWGLVLLVPLYQIDTSLFNRSNWWLHPAVMNILFGFVVTLIVTLQIRSSKKSGELLKALFDDMSETSALFFYEDEILQDYKSGKEIRLYNLTEKMKKNIEERHAQSTKLMQENYKQFNATMVPTNALFQLMTFIIYAYIGLLVLTGIIQLAYIIQLSSALSQMVSALPDFIQHTMMMLSSPDDLKRYYDFMDTPDDEMIGSLPVEKRLDHHYELEVNNLNFVYPDSDDLVLENISETFEVGKKYAIVGENGSGKTTFIKLLVRLFEPTTGNIKMNHIDANKYDLKEYFDLFGVVFQDYHLVGFSIGQNIAVQPTFDTSRVLATLDRVGLGEFVKLLPNQENTSLDTEFDESGVSISGGQAQKIAIARSLYKDAPIMILDEPTAALDPMTEFEIYQNFDKLVEDKTAFYISHRLSSSKFCDEILVFDQGQIIQRGTHDELLQEEGKYKELWSAQAQYYQ